MLDSSLSLSSSTEQRIRAAAGVLRLTPDAFLRRLLSQHYNTLGGLPIDLLRYILAFLDYTTISGLVARVSKFWQDCVLESPQSFFSRLRQVHGIHLLDPVHGMFYFPRALKRVVFDAKAGSSNSSNSSSASGGGTGVRAAAGLRSGADLRRAFSPASAALHTNAQAVPASSFLTVDIRTQNTRTLPWGYVQMTVRQAIERERNEYGAVRTPGLQRPEDPVWSQAATVTYNRLIYMFGGETYEGVVLDRAYEYDPMAKHWAVLPDMNEKRAAASAAVFHGRIFVFGGYNEAGEVLDTYEVLDVATRSWVSRHYPPSWMFASGTDTGAMAPPISRPSAGTRFSDGAGASASQYTMPEKVCGTATTVFGEVMLFAGGHRSCIAPDQTAVSYSAMNSASTTPMHSVGGPHGATAGNQSAAGTPSPGLGGGGLSGRSGHGGEPTSATLGTPMHRGLDSITTPTTAGVAGNATSTSTRADSPPRLPRVNSIAFDGPATAETLVWVFSPITGQWWTEGPRLPSPRAFGASAVLELPILGPCLCYFGGCAKADAPETAMFYIPLCDPQCTRTRRTCCCHDAEEKCASTRTAVAAAAAQSLPSQSLKTANFLHAAQDPWPATVQEKEASPQTSQQADAAHGFSTANTTVARAVSTCTAAATGSATSKPALTPSLSTPTTSCATPGGRDEGSPLTRTQPPTEYIHSPLADMIARCFRDPEELPWQRYVRVPIGGAFTSVAVVGSARSRTVVLTGFYPAPNIGFCKVSRLLPLDAFTPLLGALSPPSSPPILAAPSRATATVSEPSSSFPSSLPQRTSPTSATVRSAVRASPPPPLQLDPSLQDEATAAAMHFHQEREWSHHQRQEVREMVRAAARAATMRHPRNPQTAGEEHKWSLAPVPEVRVRNPTGPALTRVSWKVQSLNAKVIVAIE